MDDNIEFLNILEELLGIEKDFEIIGAFTTKEDVINFVKKNKIDVMLMDVNLTGDSHDGIDAVYQIQQIQKIKTIMLSGISNNDVFLKAYDAGVSLFVQKINFNFIPHAIVSVYKNNYPTEVLANEYKSLKKEKMFDSLTECEQQIIEYSNKGLSRKQIVAKTNKAMSTIRNQISSILKKIDVKSLKEAVFKLKN